MAAVDDVLAIKVWSPDIALRQTKWVTPPALQTCQTFFAPLGMYTRNITDETTDQVNNYSYAHYLHRVVAGFSKAIVQLKVTTAGNALSELYICKGTPAIGTGTTLSILGQTDCTAIFSTTGLKNVTITLTTPTAVGDHIWIVVHQEKEGAQDALARFRAYIEDDIHSGYLIEYDSAPPGVFTVCDSKLFGFWCAIGLS